MNKTLQVFLYELKTTVLRKSFILTLLLIPLSGLIVTLVLGNRSDNSGVATILSSLTGTEEEISWIGLVDDSKLINTIPDDYSSSILLIPTEAEANQALENNQIKAFYVIPENYVEAGDVFVYRPDFNPLSAGEDNYKIERVLIMNLLSDQNELKRLIIDYPDFEVELLSPEPQRDPENQLTFFLPYIVTFLFYFVILASASLMLNSVTNEKSNRVIEILLTSVTPLQLLSGKITALGLTGLLQTVVWSGSGLLILRFSGRNLSLTSEFQLPISILFWGVIFFICGYALFESISLSDNFFPYRSIPNRNDLPASHNAAIANKTSSEMVKRVCQSGIFEKAALIGRLTGAVNGKMLKIIEMSEFGFSINICKNQKGITIGSVNKPAICCASLDSVVVAPSAAIIAAIITNAGMNTAIVINKNDKSICPVFKSGNMRNIAMNPSKPKITQTTSWVKPTLKLPITFAVIN